MSDGIDFEASAEGATACVACRQPIAHEYWEANGKAVCSGCKERVETQGLSGTPASRFLMASALGVGAMAVGALAWWAVAKYAGLQAALVAIGIGWLVGLAVRFGSQGRGGWLYQTLAVALTYLSVTLAITALAVDAAGGDIPLPAAFLVALIAPVLNGWGSILSVLIILFGLYQAWKMNRRTSILWSGPHRSGEARAHSALPPLPGDDSR